MKNLSLLWVGEDIHATEPEHNIGSLRRPYYISMGGEENLILGRLRDPQSNYIRIWSRLNKSLVSPNHASIERRLDGFVISDHSVTGTYVNNVRILKSTPLNDGDVICFGNEGDTSIKPGAAVEIVKSDLKYRVLIEPDFQALQSNNGRLSTYCQSNLAKAPGTKTVPIFDIIDLTERENSNIVNSEVFTQATNIGYMQYSPSNDDYDSNSPVTIRGTVGVFKTTPNQNNPDNSSNSENEEATMSELSKNSKESESTTKPMNNEQRESISNTRSVLKPIFNSPILDEKNDDLSIINNAQQPAEIHTKENGQNNLKKFQKNGLTALKSGRRSENTRKERSLSKVRPVKFRSSHGKGRLNSSKKRRPSLREESQNSVEIYEYPYCSSESCLMPLGDQIDWIFCDFCEKWYHQACVRLKVVPKGEYSCPSCSQK